MYIVFVHVVATCALYNSVVKKCIYIVHVPYFIHFEPFSDS